MLSSHFKSIVDRWNSYWFTESTGLPLALTRIVVVAAQLFIFFPSLESQLMFFQPFRGLIEPQILIVAISKLLPYHLFLTVPVFTTLYCVTIIAGIATLIGFFTRTSAFVFALGNWILVAHGYSYGEDHHPEAILCILLMLFALSPSGRRLSADALLRRRSRGLSNGDLPEKVHAAVWPLKLTQVLLCFAYVSTGLAKLVYGGLAWMNGYTLQQIIFTSAVSRDLPLGIWLAQQHLLCLWLSVGVILFEVFFFVSLLFPKTLPYFLLNGILLHLGIYLTEGSPFFQYIVLYAVFIDCDKWFARAQKFLRRTRYGEGAVESSQIAASV